MVAQLARLALACVLVLMGCGTGRPAGSGLGLPAEALHAFESAREGEAWLHDPSSTPRPVIWRRAMDTPIDAAVVVEKLADSLAAKSDDPAAVIRTLGAELPVKGGGSRVGRAGVAAGVASRSGIDPLPVPLLPADELATLPAQLRAPIERVLAAIMDAESARRVALASVPAELTAERIREQVLNGPSAPGDYRVAMETVAIEALASAGADLAGAVSRLRGELGRLAPIPPVVWKRDTSLGMVLVDTTGADNRHRLVDPLLVIDVGGNDIYEFVSRGDRSRISVLLDMGGDDSYSIERDGADPSAAILGIGILWDTSGNDTYRGGHFAQASAAFGVALLVDEAGENRFEAIGHSQAHAVAGMAVMITGKGGDRYLAQTAAQGSAGPGGVALLMDRGGNDHYALTATPLVRPSAQLPERNASIGQGTGYGIRVGPAGGGPAAGGFGLLLDLAGDDRYEGQVFAQGTGYQQGVGVLVDFGGRDRFGSAWYGMAASAHGGVGMLSKRGAGGDHYRVSHTMGIGAAHDFSVAVFLDAGGDDSYFIPGLGLGVAHDSGLAIFLDADGSDTYSVSDVRAGTSTAMSCLAMGEAASSGQEAATSRMANVALFADLAGDDRWPVACAGKRGQGRWRIAR